MHTCVCACMHAHTHACKIGKLPACTLHVLERSCILPIPNPSCPTLPYPLPHTPGCSHQQVEEAVVTQQQYDLAAQGLSLLLQAREQGGHLH